MNINEQLIRLFIESPDVFLSGEELSQKMNCSRTAVWKHIERLRMEGYVFEAVSRKGYRFISKPDKLDIEQLTAKLQTTIVGRSILYYDEVESTNTVAHSLVLEGAAEGTLVIAEHQTSGRGRMGRKWYSPKGKGLWMSLVLKPRIPLQLAPQLTLLVAVALCRSIRKLTAIDAGIKWPNDLLVDGKKISGILLESSADEEKLQHVIAGVGISVNLDPDDFPEEIKDVATSLSIQAGSKIDRAELLCQFLLELEGLYELYQEQGFAPIKMLWEALNVSIGCTVRQQSNKGLIEGIAEGIDDHGALVVRLADGTLTKWYSSNVEFGSR
ncbi:biotin--[acetyl-CoA-carboxylase] ligase [Paenibacillus agricola]|uniref:Bifunctional ligase/repressor BirA n=1 Tax=Paenibacillus agricola TaxID=2716264 RepID=A0ABX0J3W1_9BACL|nr:biotin--[acetyl-CoA-carboxylase] ligase [Paenibacillus agricola]NHN28689.1 biotin--[acetyl-CoA-carboxylase] ligase [Paenibacillus agricola]